MVRAPTFEDEYTRASRRQDVAKINLTADPSKLDDLVGDISESVSPSLARPDAKKYARKVDAVDAAIPAGDPMKGFGPALHARVSEAIANPAYRGYSAQELTAHFAKKELLAAPNSKTGESRLEGAYRTKRAADASWFGLAGPNDAVKKLPGYDEWLGSKRAQEDERDKGESYLPSLSDVGRAAVEGAGVGAAFGGVTAGLASGGAGILPGAVAGAAVSAPLWAALEPIAHPIRKVLHGTEWYRSKEESPEFGEKAKMFVADAIPYLAADLGLRHAGGAIVKEAATQALGGEAKGMVGGLAAPLANVLKPNVTEGMSKSLNDYFTNATLGRGGDLGIRDDIVALTAADSTRKAALAQLQAKPSADNLINLARVSKTAKEAEDSFTLKMHGRDGRANAYNLADAVDSVNEDYAKSQRISQGLALPEPSRFNPGSPDYHVKSGADLDYSGPGRDVRSAGSVEDVNGPSGPGWTASNREQAIAGAEINSPGYKIRSGADVSDKWSFIKPGEGRDVRSGGSVEDVPQVPSRALTAQSIGQSKSPTLLRTDIQSSVSGLDTDAWWSKMYGVKAPIKSVDMVDPKNMSAEGFDRVMGNPSSVKMVYDGEQTIKRADSVARFYNLRDTGKLQGSGIEPSSGGATKFSYRTDIEGNTVADKSAEVGAKYVQARMEASAKLDAAVAKKSIPLARFADAEAAKIGPNRMHFGADENLASKFAAWKEQTDSIKAEITARSNAAAPEIGPKIPDVIAAPPVETAPAVEKVSADRTTKLRKKGVAKAVAPEVEAAPAPAASLSDEAFATVQKQVEAEKFHPELMKMYEWQKANPGKDMPAGYTAEGSKAMSSAEIKAEIQSRNAAADAKLGEAQEANKAWKTEQAGESYLQGKFILPILAGAVSIPVIGSLLSPKEADAGMINGRMASAVWDGVKGALNSGADAAKVAKELMDTNLISRGVKDGEFRFIPQEGLSIKPVAPVRTESLPIALDKVASPNTFGRVYYPEGSNSAVELGSRTNAVANNTVDGLKALSNILDAHPEIVSQGRGVVKEMDAAMQPVRDGYLNTSNAYRALGGKIVSLEDIAIPEMAKRLKKEPGLMDQLDILKSELADTQKAQEALKPQMEQLTGAWEDVAKDATDKYARARVALAAEDTSDFQKYPWLKEKMTYDDTVAAARIKQFNQDYTIRMESSGHQVLSDYMPHMWPESWRADANATAKVLEDLGVPDAKNAIPFTKFFHRAENSRMMILDPEYNLSRYIPDAEKRIQYSQFWGKKYDQSSWLNHSQSDIVQANPALRDYWARVKDSFKPPENTNVNQMLNRYAAFETLRLIGGGLSAPLKHLFKLPGTMAQFGVLNTLKAMPQAARLIVNKTLQDSVDRGFLKSIGIRSFNSGEDGRMWNQLIDSFATRTRFQNIFNELDPNMASKFDSFMYKVNDIATLPITAVEKYDRTVSFLAALNQASRSGMTSEQAVYGVYDTILKNNFMSGVNSPNWLRDPKIRALTMFQGTPFKIWERRLTNAYMTQKDIGKAYDVIPGNGVVEKLQQLAGLKNYVQEGQDAFKRHMIVDALTSSKDIFGTPYSSQFMKEALVLGGLMTGGSAAGLNLHAQVAHFPFLREGSNDPTLATSPIIGGTYKTVLGRHDKAVAGEDQSFIVSDFLKNWLGRNNVVPLTIHKAMRISDNDIPAQYSGSGLRYFFSVPSKTE